MSQAVTGCVVDEITGEPLASPDVRLYRIGVVGETCIPLNEHGCFTLPDLPEGKYSLAFYDRKYVSRYEELTLAQGQSIDAMRIALKPGGFLSGSILDEAQRPPERCYIHLIRLSERKGESGYISDSCDHKVSDDGTFCSPPLRPAQYFLRFSGVLQKAAEADPVEPRHITMQKRIFDFLYPNAQEISEATGFDVQLGQTISNLDLRIPRPVWHTVQGKVVGDLPAGPNKIYVMFSRTMGTIETISGIVGSPVQQDGTFEHQLQSGNYHVEVWEHAPPEPNGSTRIVRTFLVTSIQIINNDLCGLEIPIAF